MSAIAKDCIKLGRKSAYSTSEFVELFGGSVDLKNQVTAKDKDQMIVLMANVIMELSSRGKFDLSDF